MINVQAFTRIAGNTAKWDKDMTRRVAAGERLTDVQVDHHKRGFRAAQLVKGILGYYVRAVSGLEEHRILANMVQRGGVLDGSRQMAIQWGTEWANKKPTHREFIALKTLLESEDE